MRLAKSVGANLVGGIWLGLLMLLTTPLYVSLLGFEGYGLIGIWQLLLFLALVFDFGLSATLTRQFAEHLGGASSTDLLYRLFLSVEKIFFVIAVMVVLFLCCGAEWIAHRWLEFEVLPLSDVVRAIRLMALTIGLQFLCALYIAALIGLQRQVTMNLLQAINNALRYGGGVCALLISNSVVGLFAFQAVAALISVAMLRGGVLRCLGERRQPLMTFRLADVRDSWRYSSGMFVIACFGVLIGNADRIAVSKMLPANQFGQYSVALVAVGLLQMIVVAFYRAYLPRLAELSGGGRKSELKSVYYAGCRNVAFLVVPLGSLFVGFAPDIFGIWLNRYESSLVNVSRLLVIGAVLSGVMWLPAARQQAVGWTRLHATLMGVSLVVGVPLMIRLIQSHGVTGGAALSLVHGIIEVTLGLWLMNRMLYPGETIRWYRDVLLWPVSTSIVLVSISVVLMPHGLQVLETAAWISVTTLILFSVLAVRIHRLRRGQTV